jgi:hypothetical protein
MTEKLVDDILSKLSNRDITMASITIIIIETLQLTHKINGSKELKKDVAIQVINRLVERSGNQELASLVSAILPSMIDGLISLDKRELIIKTDEDFKKCCCSFKFL